MKHAPDLSLDELWLSMERIEAMARMNPEEMMQPENETVLLGMTLVTTYATLLHRGIPASVLFHIIETMSVDLAFVAGIPAENTAGYTLWAMMTAYEDLRKRGFSRDFLVNKMKTMAWVCDVKPHVPISP